MLAYIHQCKGADVPDPDDVNGVIAVEVDDIERSSGQAEHQDERGDDWTQQLLKNVHLKHERLAVRDENFSVLFT